MQQPIQKFDANSEWENPLEIELEAERQRSKNFWDAVNVRSAVSRPEPDRTNVTNDFVPIKAKPKQEQANSQKGSTRPEKRQVQRPDKGKTLITKTPTKSIKNKAANNYQDQLPPPRAFIAEVKNEVIHKTPKNVVGKNLAGEPSHKHTERSQSPRNPELEQEILAAKNKMIEQSLRSRNRATKALNVVLRKSNMEDGLESLLQRVQTENFSTEKFIAGKNRS